MRRVLKRGPSDFCEFLEYGDHHGPFCPIWGNMRAIPLSHKHFGSFPSICTLKYDFYLAYLTCIDGLKFSICQVEITPKLMRGGGGRSDRLSEQESQVFSADR